MKATKWTAHAPRSDKHDNQLVVFRNGWTAACFTPAHPGTHLELSFSALGRLDGHVPLMVKSKSSIFLTPCLSMHSWKNLSSPHGPNFQGTLQSSLKASLGQFPK